MKGDSSTDVYGIYGTRGVAAAANKPGSRAYSVTWTDKSGNLWLFGGDGYAVPGTTGGYELNDLWKYSIGTNQWTWMKGEDTINVYGVYGTQGVAAPANMPGGRAYASAWTDTSGNLWLFGGSGYAASGGFGGDLNDLWKYNIASNNWTWMKGDSNGSVYGAVYSVYGAQGVAAATNKPGCRYYSLSWTDASNNLWLFGGLGYATSGLSSELNDLWEYNIASNNWTWVKGDNTTNVHGVYGTQGVAAATNKPGSRYEGVRWTDASGNLWLFGGDGYSANALGELDDLWEYNTASNNWTWMKGDSTTGHVCIYGTQGVAAATNKPGSRGVGVTWTDASGNLWLFGGTGFAASSQGKLDDLWEYTMTSNNWTWVKGDNTPNVNGNYGTQGVATATNKPGSRNVDVSWTDIPGNLWLFGGMGYPASGGSGSLNDLWKLGLCPPLAITNATTVCQGSSQTLSVTGASTYLWMPAASLNSANISIVTANPTVTTTYTVIGTDIGGCINSVTTTLGVYGLPALTTSPGVSICPGNSTTLTVGGTGTYVWNPATYLSSTTGSTVTVGPIALSGVEEYTVSETDAVTGCMNSAQVTVNVNPTPTISGNNPLVVCQGNSAIYTLTGASTYIWSPATYLDTNTGADVIASPTIFGVYGFSVTGTDNNGCSSIGTTTVTVAAALTANAGSDQSICSGATASLAGTGGASYAWLPAMGLNSVTSQSPTFNLDTPGNYTYTLTVSSGSCKSDTEVTIAVYPLPTVTASPGATICSGNSAVLTAGGTVQYTWSPATGLSLTQGQSINAMPTATTLYTVKGTDANGCMNSTVMDVTVTLYPLPTVSLFPGNITICNGSSITLSALGETVQGPMNYLWGPSANLSSDTAITVISSPSITTSYTVTGTDGNGCYNTMSASVSVTSLPLITIAPGNVSICYGTSAGLTATGATSYTWQPSTSLSSTTGAGITASPGTVITYKVTGSNGACAGRDSITVSIYSLPTITATAAATVCSGGSTTLSASGADAYTWNPSTGLNADTGNAVAVNLGSPGIEGYTVTGSDANNCGNFATIVVTVTSPVQVSVSPDVTIMYGSSTVISAAGGVSYTWTPGTSLSCLPASAGDSCQSPTVNPTITMVYTVTMDDANGCSSSAAITVGVRIPCNNIYVPDAFSPNADQQNDVLYVYGTNCLDYGGYNFEVYDRWGNNVFSSSNSKIGWDGTYKGKELDADVFVYTLTYAINGSTIKTKGNVSLIK